MKTCRRTFLKQSSLFTIATTVLPIQACLSGQQSIRFGVASDSHYADREPKGTRYYRGSLGKMQEFVETMNQEKVDFVIHLGDFKDEGPDKKETDTLNFLKDIESVYETFKGPRFHCIGNHDVDSITKAQFLAHITNTGVSKDKSYYSFDQNGFHFVVLDANRHKDGSHHFFKEGSDWQDTNLGEKQTIWLQTDLQNTNLPTIVFCHHPLFEYHGEGHKYHINNYKKVQGILEESNKVLTVFQGHVHNESHKRINGIHYITQLGMVDYEGLENNSFSIVEINGNELKINGYKRTTTNLFEI
ncbi:metallophosphoesterase family protein [Maribacter sp. 2304DJ31-5]|uniref:metallophosphoesterase family protein n=1 Tax=Maribacter sp. 2304DJ31-5 TaxID=3386273 RepID=UPI0039BC51B9